MALYQRFENPKKTKFALSLYQLIQILFDQYGAIADRRIIIINDTKQESANAERKKTNKRALFNAERAKTKKRALTRKGRKQTKKRYRGKNEGKQKSAMLPNRTEPNRTGPTLSPIRPPDPVPYRCCG